MKCGKAMDKSIQRKIEGKNFFRWWWWANKSRKLNGKVNRIEMISLEKLRSMSENSSNSVVFFELEDSTEKLLMTENGYIAAAVVLFFIGFFGFFLNLVVIILMIREKRVSNLNLFYIFSFTLT